MLDSVNNHTVYVFILNVIGQCVCTCKAVHTLNITTITQCVYYQVEGFEKDKLTLSHRHAQEMEEVCVNYCPCSQLHDL